MVKCVIFTPSYLLELTLYRLEEHFKRFVKIVEAVVAYHKEKESEKTVVKSEEEN